MDEQFLAREQDEREFTSLPPSAVIGWRSRVLFAFEADKHVLSFSDVRGRLFRIPKAQEIDGYVCELLREPGTIARLLEQVQLRDPHWPAKRVYRLLKLLMDRDLLEQKDTAIPSTISEEDLSLYDRQLRFFGLFAHRSEDRFHMQNALKQATVTILGVGGVGTWVARNLAAMGIGHLRLVDCDRIERSNLNRQMLYTPADLGQLKVEVAARALTTVYPQLDVQAIPMKIASPEDIEGVVAGVSMAVLTADKPMREIRRWMALACMRQQLAYVQGSLDAYFLQIGPLYHVPSTGCYGCREARMRQDQPYASLAVDNSPPLARESPPLLAPLCGFVGSAVALEVARYLSKFQPPSTLGRYYIIDVRTWTTQIEVVPHEKECSLCGSFFPASASTETIVQDGGKHF